MSLLSNLELILSEKNSIKESIIAKGGSVEDFTTYSEAIDALQVGGRTFNALFAIEQDEDGYLWSRSNDETGTKSPYSLDRDGNFIVDTYEDEVSVYQINEKMELEVTW